VVDRIQVYGLPEELEFVRDIARRFTETELMPLEKMVQEREISRGLSAEPLIPKEVHEHLDKKARELDLFGLDVPEELGGQGLGFMYKAVVLEEINRSITPYRLPPESPNLSWLIEEATPEQTEKYLLPYSRGDKRSSLALTEPNAGSDAAAIEATATRSEGGWVLNGTKTFISRCDEADFFIVIAVTDKAKRGRGGISAFLVDKGTPGFKIGRYIWTMGYDTPSELIFEDCFVPDSQVLGEIGWAFKPLQKRLGVRRSEIAARCLGHAERLVQLMVDQANNRVTFGKPLAERQAVQWMIADSVMSIHAARLMVMDVAAKMDAGVPDVRNESSIAKVFATEMVSTIVDRALQLHGGIGYTKDSPIEFIYRNSRALRIVEGASEIHRRQIARFRLQG